MKNNQNEYKITGDKVVETVKKIIKEGNARRIIIKNEKQETVMEFPVTVGAVGIILAPILAALGALAAVLTNCTIIVKRKNAK